MSGKRRSALLAVLLLLASACGNDDTEIAGATENRPGDSGTDENTVVETDPPETEETKSEAGESESDDSDPGHDDSADDTDESDKSDEADEAEWESSGGIDGCRDKTGEAATGEPILVGAILGSTGPANFGIASEGTRALFECVNANGGINGRPITYITYDDRWNPDESIGLGNRLVEGDGVVALIGGAGFYECTGNAGYYTHHGVAVIYAQATYTDCFEAASIAPVNTGPRLGMIGLAQQAVADGASPLCLTNLIPTVGVWSCAGVEAWAAEVGVTVITDATRLPTPVGIEEAIDEVIAHGTDAVLITQPGGVTLAYLAEMASRGVDVPWYASSLTYWGGRLTVFSENGDLFGDGDDTTLWRQVMADHAPDAPLDGLTQGGFLSGLIFIEALMELDPNTLDRATVTEALVAIDDFESDLLCNPWYFGEGDRHNPNDAGRVVRLSADGSAWEPAGECFDIADPALEGLRTDD